MDVGCYCVSGARLLGGEPESVAGAAAIGSSGTDWVFTGLMRFPGDVVALFDCGTSLPNRDELEAIGTEGSVFLDDPWHCQLPVIELRRRLGGANRDRGGESLPVGAEDLNAAIRAALPPLLGREDAMGQVRAIDACSAARGRRVSPSGGENRSAAAA
jgi:predicted dehydrogenase